MIEMAEKMEGRKMFTPLCGVRGSMASIVFVYAN